MGNRTLGYAGIALGGLSLIGFATGFLDIIITDGIGRVGPLSLLMFVYLIAVGYALVRGKRG